MRANIAIYSNSELHYSLCNFYKAKSAQRRCKHCTLAVVRQSQKISPCSRPSSRGHGTAKIKSAGDGHYLYQQTHFGEDRCTQFSSYRGNRPTLATHHLSATDRTDYNTLHRSLARSVKIQTFYQIQSSCRTARL